jgi:hypothetical protein
LHFFLRVGLDEGVLKAFIKSNALVWIELQHFLEDVKSLYWGSGEHHSEIFAILLRIVP